MCGICGYISRKIINEQELRIMNDTMIHRGPNDNGVEIYDGPDGYCIGMAQRRLSIVDLSPLGHQPMHSADKRVTVVFNGEVYNFLDLKKELSDYPFKSTCDTEVIIAAYLKWGIHFTDHIHGMFAIALYDRETEDLYLVRDRIGKKPLYYWLDGDNLVYASELKPIMKCPGFEGKIRREVIARYLYQQYINAPDSIFEDVYKLEPGAVLKFSKGKRQIWKYWDIRKAYAANSQNPVTSYDQAKAELKDLLKKAVADRMIADVPLGTFLSGGFDSSLITALAQDNSVEPVKTFSIGFNEKNYNEAEFAKAVASHLGTDHTELYIDEKEMFDQIESMARFYDEPFADSSQIPSMLVSKLAKQKVTVALSGDGGDEFFCGYNIYADLALARKLDFLGNIAYGIGQIPLGSGNKLLNKYPFKVRAIAENHNKETKCQLSSEGYVRAARAFMNNEEGLPCKYPIETSYPGSNWQIKRMLLDMDTYLPGDILCKMDRASMKYSLENRCPIMDTAVMEYSFRIPHEFKFYKGDKKHILKDIAYDYIPRELLDRPKVGFGVPLDKWMRGPLKEQLLSYADQDFLKKQGLFDAAYVNKFIGDYIATGDGGRASGSNYSKIAWSFFVFQQWYQYFGL
ncbi:asparagine synthase (glutamine-hydrolyzing) [Butyrivibrio fibrisolvens]|uniref:asparagine synthase (glutamine-hydrolyzing) n=1 Tax=Butyrivibrio fibrisolvens TaxID=831 RepID=A0A317FZJ0_BUTFI|nr:asparagine synthase (glutamine-hydrolyzing) [Butyrivibrio fibrisolvens]PWT26281.1 asparagine synthase (glutamine-hydrolyzing) [Butyrivibrio fibrisolvens]